MSLHGDIILNTLKEVNILKPNFVCGAYNVSPEHPSSWEIPALAGIAKNTTLDGTDVKDVAWRKFEYRLTWEAMSKEDFEDLEELINNHLDNGTDITFTYAKFPNTDSSVLVQCDPLSRSGVAGSGSTFYYQEVTLTLTEVSGR